MKKLLKKLNIDNKDDLVSFILQFIKFGFVGLSNTLVTLIIYYIFVFINPSLYLIGNAVGWFVGVINSFYWNNKYVFVSGEKGLFKKLIKTYLTYGVTFIISTLLMFLMVDVMCLSEKIAPIISLVVTIPLNFFISKFWAYK